MQQYEPELFPGLIYHMKQPKVVLLIFVSGKVVLTGTLKSTCSATVQQCCAGAKRREDIYTAFELMYPVLKMFRKGADGAAPSQAAAADDAAVMAMAVR